MLRQRPLSHVAFAAWTLAFGVFAACSSDQKPSSLATSAGSDSGGQAGTSGSSAGRGGSAGEVTTVSAAGESGATSTSEAGSDNDAALPMPIAAFPNELEADVGCNSIEPDVGLSIRNTGDEPLVISSATADSGYIVKATLPLEIAPKSSGTLLITPPAPSAHEDAGTVTGGKLSFQTNEPGTPTHVVTLTTTVYDGSIELTDSNGAPIESLQLTYDSGGACPSPTKYRVKNTGNAAVTLTGPEFSAHFAGSDLGDGGQTIPPGGYAELLVGVDSSPGNVCSATGTLSFDAMGPLCGAAPKLNLVWLQSTDPGAGSSCACAPPAF